MKTRKLAWIALIALVALFLHIVPAGLAEGSGTGVPAGSQQDRVELDDTAAATYEVGAVVSFGACEQDGDESNGKEAIEWLVLSVEDGTVLLISRDGLACQPFNENGGEATWETCSLRAWLNGAFLEAAFSAEEQAQLASVTVSADRSPKSSVKPGNDTEDRVYVLSFVEAQSLFAADEDRVCAPTAFAAAQGAETDRDGNSAWWLRSPGNTASSAAMVRSEGSLHGFGRGVDAAGVCVRPVIAMRLEAVPYTPSEEEIAAAEAAVAEAEAAYTSAAAIAEGKLLVAEQLAAAAASTQDAAVADVAETAAAEAAAAQAAADEAAAALEAARAAYDALIAD